ncbi:probable tyrosyl-DNA phosphodiesterase [Diabrotica virgifera virgifera]|uniref:PBZ-type domain-containing protein n=1 Tax=Diabrotica virgifera virgifera TaxID=50390 RepID=A0ABM5JJZ4_DIAVI|nr:probable tyrosyl-DNA phosphodiesterase [Diabrotica virgifera virgifera]
MESFLKRKIDQPDTNGKKIKRENCPHSVKCFRKNPHHFKEFDHPHLLKLIDMGSPVEIPSDFPQPQQVYLEQIEMLQSLLKTSHLKDIQNLPGSSTSAEKKPEKQEKSNSSTKTSPAKTQKGKNIAPKSSTVLEEDHVEVVHILDSPILKKSGHETMMEKIERMAPYSVFFTTIIKAPETKRQENAITFTDLLCPSLGILKNSLQINFMIDIDWLLKQYKERGLSSKPLTILYGDDWPDMEKFIKMFCPNVTSKLVKMKDPYGCHHSKIGIYVYEDNSIRIVVSTANLYYEDWNHYNQGLWVSPACKRLPDSCSEKDGDSPTKFKTHLLSYLRTYNESILKPFIEYVQKADFSAIRVFFIYSAPGKYYPNSNGSHLHAVADLLSRNCVLPAKTTPQSEGPLSWGILAQASSIGSMGKNPADWLRGSLLRCLASHKGSPKPMNSSASISIVYPSVDNVMTGYFSHESGGCLPYSKATNEKQKWLQEYMYQWKAASHGRTRAMPHIKTYCRVSPCLSKIAYFLLTSANLSKSAWGSGFGKDMGVYIRSYEAGVLFLPPFFDEEYFEISTADNNKNKRLFPFMYDLPLTSYKRDDYPWCN